MRRSATAWARIRARSLRAVIKSTRSLGKTRPPPGLRSQFPSWALRPPGRTLGAAAPALDRNAKDGLRYTNCHSTALCSPTRAALITGRNHHSVGFGVISEQSTGFPGYNSIIPKDAATIGEILKENGYSTSWFGKDHNTPDWVASQAGPFDQ